MKKFFILLNFFWLIGCSAPEKKETLRVGVDTSFYPIDFEEQEPYVYGYIQELLLEISKVTPLEIEQVRANWDVLYEGLSPGKRGSVYDVVISSKKPYNFNEALYHFSPVFLDTGLVAIFLRDAKEKSWKEMEGKRIGALGQYTFLQEKAGLLIHFYEDIPTMCDDLVEQKIDACLIPNIAAIYFLKNLYLNQMKMASFVTKEGLRFISLQDKKDHKIEKLEKALSTLESNRTLEKLKSKWGLTDSSLWDPNWKDSFEMK